MDKVWAYVIDIFIAILIIFVSVTIYFSIRTETVMKSMYKNASEEFVTSTKRSGSITINDYENYMEKMGIGNNLFDISFEHKYTILEPEYRFKTLEEIIEEQNKTYPGSNDYHYREVVTERPPVDDPINDGNMNTETNESILENAIDGPADPNHVHTDECYYGIKHIHKGSPSSGGECYGEYQSHTHTDSCYVTTYCSGVWSGKWQYKYTFQTPPVCASCGGSTSISWSTNEGTLSYSCFNCGHKGTQSYTSRETLGWYGRCLGCNASIVTQSNMGGQTHGNIRRLNCSISGAYSLNCGKTEGRYYDDKGKEVSHVCGQIVVTITPTNSNQTIYVNDSLITTATATYKDGSTKVVVCVTDAPTSTIGKNQSFTLRYNYSVVGNAYTKTFTVIVTIIPRNATCSHNHVYNLKDDGSDPGCPYCRAWVDNIRIIHPTTSPIVITIGTTLQNNNVKLLVTYMDGHTEEVSSGYIDNLDTGYLGTKSVIIGYKGESITVIVTTVRGTIVCDICGYEYELYPDGTNPGCPRCIQETPVFTGNIMEYDYLKNTEEILDELYDKGIYSFNMDDIFGLEVNNKSSSLGRKFLGKIYPSLTDRWFVVNKKEHIMSK